ncbi:MAG: peptidase S24 [Kordiimonas sp.]|nr:peptidase S24 [Kordiimonas sp.]
MIVLSLTLEDANKIARERLDSLVMERDDEDYASVSALIGKNHAYIQQYIKRGVPKKLQDKDLRKIASHFEVDIEFLDTIKIMNTSPLTEGLEATAPLDEYVLINVYDIEAAAGAGSVVDSQVIGDRLAFKRSWIKSSSSATNDNLIVISVSGDSMVPTLMDGDHILVDLNETHVRRDGIYVIRYDDMLQVKRVSIHPVDKTYTVKSDNPLYESWSNCTPGTIDVLGRVIWMGRKI